MTKEEIRTIVREEIVKAFQVLGRAADSENGYDTGELESSALYALSKVAENAVRRLTCTHERTWAPYGDTRCSSCDEPEILPENPFKESNG